MKTRHSQRGVSLIELMIAVAIVGILAVIAYPSYTKCRLKATRSQGMDCLVDTQRRMENIFVRANAYPTDLSDGRLGFSSATPFCGDQNIYQLSLSYPTNCNSQCYVLTATAQGKQVNDGNLRLTFDASKVNPNDRYKKEHQPPSGSWTGTDGWSYAPGQ